MLFLRQPKMRFIVERELKIAYNDYYIQPLPKGHRYPMEKYDLLPQQLLLEGTAEEKNFFNPGFISREHAIAVHQPDYFDDFVELKLDAKKQRRTGFKHNESLVKREQIILEGTRKCAEYALKNGVAFNSAGGTHHAYSGHGEGFCMLNDQAVAAQWLINSGKAKKILIIDLDVHQGNGTASIFQKTPEVFTFSMHGKNNYPFHKEKSDLDVELEDGTKDSPYIYALEKSLDAVVSNFAPDFLLYQAGVDILATDKLGKLKISIEGCKKRDEIVFQIAKQTNLPIVTSMGGGYSEEIKYIIEAHANTFRTAQHIFF